MPTHVFVPTHGAEPGRVGSEDYNHAVIAGLAARGYRVTACGPEQRPVPGIDGVEWLPLSPMPAPRPVTWRFSYAQQALHIHREIRQLGPRHWDVVISGLLPALWSTRRLWRGVPQVYVPQSLLASREVLTYGGAWLQNRLGALTYGLLQRWAWGHADVVVSYNEEITGIRRRYYGFSPRRLVISSPGVDTARFSPREREPELVASLGIPPDAPLVLSVCRLITFKDLPFLLSAFANPKVPRAAHLLLVGDGPRRPDLEALARDLGIADRTHFAGFRADVERYFALGHVYVLPSFLETFGLTLAQALASGVPAIARRTAYPKVLTAAEGIIDEGRTGFLVETEEDVAARIAELLGNPARRKAMGAAAAESMRLRFSWSAHIDAIEEAIRIAVADGGVHH